MTHEEVLDEVNVIYERISNNENNLFNDGNYTEALEVLIDYYEVGFIEELEKIREEIENDQEQMADENDFGKYYGMGWAIRIIDKHISRLKGEQK